METNTKPLAKTATQPMRSGKPGRQFAGRAAKSEDLPFADAPCAAIDGGMRDTSK